MWGDRPRIPAWEEADAGRSPWWNHYFFIETVVRDGRIYKQPFHLAPHWLVVLLGHQTTREDTNLLLPQIIKTEWKGDGGRQCIDMLYKILKLTIPVL